MSVEVSPDDSRVTVGLMSDNATVDSRAWTTASGFCGLETRGRRKKHHAHLRVYMLQSPHYHSTKRLVLLLPLIQSLRTTDGRVQPLLVFEAVNILGTMGVDVLKTPREFIIQAVHEAHEAAPNPDNAILFL